MDFFGSFDAALPLDDFTPPPKKITTQPHPSVEAPPSTEREEKLLDPCQIPSKCPSEAKRRRSSSSRKVRFTPPPTLPPGGQGIQGKFNMISRYLPLPIPEEISPRPLLTQCHLFYRHRHFPGQGSDRLQHQRLSRCPGHHQVDSGSLRWRLVDGGREWKTDHYQRRCYRHEGSTLQPVPSRVSRPRPTTSFQTDQLSSSTLSTPPLESSSISLDRKTPKLVMEPPQSLSSPERSSKRSRSTSNRASAPRSSSRVSGEPLSWPSIRSKRLLFAPTTPTDAILLPSWLLRP